MPTKNINAKIAAEISWARTQDRSARTRPAREAFLKRFEHEVDPDNKLPPDERARRANHALRAHMLRLRKRSALSKKNRLRGHMAAIGNVLRLAASFRACRHPRRLTSF